MLFNSYFFIFVFLPLILAAFFFTAKYSHRFALAVLFSASLIFYGWNDYHYLVPLLSSILVNFCTARRILTGRMKKIFLTLGVSFNLILLSYYKYTDFFIENVNYIFHSDLAVLKITLPLGISFFTFTQIAFLVDCYRGLVKQCHPLNYGLFVTYFPHLIAGPIIHHKEVMPQFEKSRTFQFNYRHFLLGVNLFAIGLFKKAVLADYLGALVGPVFDVHLSFVSTLDAWVAAIAYTFELYFDFSGYSDMAIGLSLLIGIKLPVNFFSPYKAVNIIEFWRRWNMTLSRFLRDYLYIPLGGNRHGSIRRYGNLLVTMILGGLWHGASWTFVLWGCLHGTYLCINHAWIGLKNMLGIQHRASIVGRLLSGTITFLAVVIAWVLFRAPDFSTAKIILKSMFIQKWVFPDNLHIPLTVKAMLQKANIGFAAEPTWVVSQKAFALLLMAALIVWLLPNTYQIFRKYKPAFLGTQHHDLNTPKLFAWQPRLAWNYAMVFVFVFAVLHIHASNIFLYFRF